MFELYFETYGCTANLNSTEIMKGLVKTGGLNLTENEGYADIVLINSCIVKEGSEEKIRRRITDLTRAGKKSRGLRSKSPMNKNRPSVRAGKRRGK